MKFTIASLLLLIFVAAGAAHAQDPAKLDTVESCRADREVWLTSADKDIKALSVGELWGRGNELTNCARNIDKEVIHKGATIKEALANAIDNAAYAILTSNYNAEIRDRMHSFLEKRDLVRVFAAEDLKKHQ